jgi:hypothetical protein
LVGNTQYALFHEIKQNRDETVQHRNKKSIGAYIECETVTRVRSPARPVAFGSAEVF